MTFVSVITSTYNRFRFIPRLIEMYRSQTYPHDQMEWLILDDGDHKTQPLFAGITLPNIRYMSYDTKLTMGAKLNILKQEAKGDIVVVMDDDDYYPPERVATAVTALETSQTEMAGASKVYMYYTDSREIYCTGPYHDKHALNCTMAWRSSYSKSHQYDDNESCAVEHKFLDDFTTPMVQLDSQKTILHIIHSSNSYNAIRARNNGTLGYKTTLGLTDFMSAKQALSFIDAY